MTSVEVFDMPKAEGDGRKIKRGSFGALSFKEAAD
jgi:hypothetical protein